MTVLRNSLLATWPCVLLWACPAIAERPATAPGDAAVPPAVADEHAHHHGAEKLSPVAARRVEDPSADRVAASGDEAFAAGRFAAAVQAWGEARARYAAAGQAERYCDLSASLSMAHHALGFQLRAIEAADEGLAVARDTQDAACEAVLLAARGRAAAFSREWASAEENLIDARRIAEAQDNAALLATVCNDLGNLYSARDDTAADALAAYDAALDHADRAAAGSIDPTLPATVAANAALTASRARDASAAQRLERAGPLVSELPRGYVKGHLLITLSDARQALLALTTQNDAARQARAAYDAAMAAGEVARAIDNPLLESHAWGRLGELYAARGKPDDALFALRKAAFLAQQAQSSDAAFRWQWNLGRLLRDRGEIDSAIDAYKRALALLSQRSLANIRHDLAIGQAGPNAGRTFRETVGQVFYEAADLLLRRADKAGDAAGVDESLRLARDAIEQLKSAELEDYFQDDCVNLVRQKARAIDVGLEKTAIVYVIPLADRTEVLLTTPAGLQRFRSDVSRTALENDVRELRARLEDELDTSYREYAGNLYDWLIRPMVADLEAQGIDTLVFVPDGELRTVPMSALYDRQNRRHLLEQFAVAVSPGLELTDPRPLARRENVEVLAAGLSEMPSIHAESFNSLPSVRDELTEINQMFGGVKLADEQFQRRAFASQFQGDTFTIVHIASHGLFKGSAKDTFVLTYDGKLYLNDLEKLIQPSQFRGEPVELLTLSACQTAAGEDASRAALGLAGVAIKAGARSALASLWSVNDEASTRLIGTFYGQLQSNPATTKAEALRQAQLELLKVPATRHPRYWAPYLIIGNWK